MRRITYDICGSAQINKKGQLSLALFCTGSLPGATLEVVRGDDTAVSNRGEATPLALGRRMSHVHTAHAAHPTHAAAASRLILRQLGHHCVGGEHQGCDRCRILQRVTGHFGWVQNAKFD